MTDKRTEMQMIWYNIEDDPRAVVPIINTAVTQIDFNTAALPCNLVYYACMIREDHKLLIVFYII